jgi:hypothetical protein
MVRLYVSDRTLAELLVERLRGRRAFQLFLRRLGPKDVVYASTWSFGADGNHLECRASAIDPVEAIVQLLQNLDQAYANDDEENEP